MRQHSKKITRSSSISDRQHVTQHDTKRASLVSPWREWLRIKKDTDAPTLVGVQWENLSQIGGHYHASENESNAAEAANI